MSDSSDGPRPGLRKAYPQPLVRTRTRTLVRTEDVDWRALFETADVVSEGDPNGNEWFGTTSIVLNLSTTSPPWRAFITALAERDLHLRVRALREACREAQTRSPSPLETVRAELTFVTQETAIRIDVDVEAPFKGKTLSRSG